MPQGLSADQSVSTGHSGVNRAGRVACPCVCTWNREVEADRVWGPFGGPQARPDQMLQRDWSNPGPLVGQPRLRMGPDSG
jgi:hypothetical protein